MNSRPPKLIVLLLCTLMVLTGCVPAQPLYLNDTGDLSYYLDQATEVSYPEVETIPLDEVTQTRPPITVAEADFDSFWDLSLEDVVSMALQNSKVFRGFGTPGLQAGRVTPGVDTLTSQINAVGTIYNVAIRETEPGFIPFPGQQIPQAGSIQTASALEANQGVEAALADFDTHFSSRLFFDRTDQPRNVTQAGQNFGVPLVFVQDQVTWDMELSKKAATGTQIFFRNVNSYNANNVPLASQGGFQALQSVYQTALEIELRQPLLRGRGTFINRMPIVISRIQTDQEIANLEAQVQNMVTNVEIRYWDLYCAYRQLKSAKEGANAALDAWRYVNAQAQAEVAAGMNEAQAREQYLFFRGEVERAWSTLLDAEANLRWLMGIAQTDGRLIRPSDEPTKAWVKFDWCQAVDEALVYRPEVRQEKWEVQKRELQVAYAKNSLLPSMNATALYRWLGLGDEYINQDQVVPQFPQEGSGAWNELFDGSYQEFRLGLDFGLPIGFRRELANVRNAQLELAREIARMEDLELDVTRELSEAVRALDLNFQLAQTNFNRWIASEKEVRARMARIGVIEGFPFLLDSQRRRSQAEFQFYQAICEYQKLIALIHRRKGTILDYSGICWSEGPWPDKAYYDAHENARRRSASRHVNYGWTRPWVISQGSAGGCVDGSCEVPLEGPHGEGIYYDQTYDSEIIYPGEVVDPSWLEGVGQPQPAEPQSPQNQLPTPANQDTQTMSAPRYSVPVERPTATAHAAIAGPPAGVAARLGGTGLIDMRRFGLSRTGVPADNSQAQIRQVNYEQPVTPPISK